MMAPKKILLMRDVDWIESTVQFAATQPVMSRPFSKLTPNTSKRARITVVTVIVVV